MSDASDSPRAPLAMAPRLLLRMTEAATLAPRLTVLVALLFTLLSAWIATDLDVRTGKLALVPKQDAEVQRYLATNDAFGTLNRLLVVLDGPRALGAASALAERLGRYPEHVREAEARVDLDSYVEQYLHTISLERVVGHRQRLEDARLDLQALGRSPELATLFERVSRPGQLDRPPTKEDLESLDELVSYLLGEPGSPLSWLQSGGSRQNGLPPFVTAEGRYASHDRQLALVMVRPATMADTTSELRPLIEAVESEVVLVEAEFQVSSIIGGEPALKMDEVRAAERSLVRSGAASLVGVTVLFFFAFRRRTLPYLGIAGLLCSVVWTFAWATLAVGHLTVVSSSFLAILIGLGVDFAIHLTCHYEAARKRIPDPREALLEAAHDAAPGVFTGALTTSAGFFSMLLVGFPAFRGLGVVAGGGILLAVLETFTLLPASILLVVGREPQETSDEPCPGEGATATLAERLVATPALGVLVTLGVIAASLSPAWALRFETNLLALNDPESPSMRLQDTFLRDFGFTPTMNIVVVDDLETLQKATQALEAMDSVGLVDSLARRVPVAPGDRDQELARLRELLGDSPRIPPEADSHPERRTAAARKMARRLAALRVLLLARSDPGGAYSAERLRRDLLRLAEADPEAVSKREDSVFAALHEDLGRLRASAHAAPATVESLPEEDRARYRSADGRFAIYVAPALDVRRDEEGQRFVHSVRAVAHSIGATFTGLVPLQRHMVELLEGGYRDTCLYALLAVIILLALDLRRPGLILLVLSVCITGVITLRASMYLHGISLNAANFIAVPLLLGVGVDNAVHLIHPWLRGQGVQEVLATSGRPILLNSITSMFGFGGLLLADHQGLYSLGWSLAMGVLWCTVATFLLIPGGLRALTRPRAAWGVEAETLLSDRFD